ncbi:signal peptidase [Marmoricola sp. OAE513]|uniref:signal peptidase I n=1 Tax=Marmoricola sp. OAE513 TaxID=2817894 RepID=UPI001AE626B1
MTNQRTVRTVAGRAFALLVAGFVIVVLGATVLVPAVGGGTAYTVLTGSMRPQLPPGTVVVVRPAAADDIRVGDVVTYQIESGKPTVATHRVVSISLDGKGDRRFITQGDANGAPDPEPVRPKQIRGVLWYAVPYVGYPARMVDGDIRRLAVSGAILVLFGYAAFSFGGAARDGIRNRRNRRDGTTVASEENVNEQRELHEVGS